jgi:hypothetical protein
VSATLTWVCIPLSSISNYWSSTYTDRRHKHIKSSWNTARQYLLVYTRQQAAYQFYCKSLACQIQLPVLQAVIGRWNLLILNLYFMVYVIVHIYKKPSLTFPRVSTHYTLILIPITLKGVFGVKILWRKGLPPVLTTFRP